MKTRYSPSTRTSYPLDIDYGDKLPSDLIEVPLADYEAAMAARAAGNEADFVDGLLVITSPPPPSLGALKAAKLAALNVASQAVASQMTAGYPEFEKLTWEDQRREATAWNADKATPTPYIDVLAQERGIDRVEYLQRTVAKTTAFAAVAQKLVGQRQRYEDQIKAATTPAALDAITPAFNVGLS